MPAPVAFLEKPALWDANLYGMSPALIVKSKSGELVKMGDDRLTPHSSKAEIDTTLPFDSVRAAVSLFGEKVVLRKPRYPERALRESELHGAQDELTKVREQLTNTDKAKEKALFELAEVRKLLVETSKKLEEVESSKEKSRVAFEIFGLSTEAIETSKEQAEENHGPWEAQLKIAKEQHLLTMAELETTKEELTKMKREILACLNEKENAVRQAEEALIVAETNAKRVDELTAELLGTNESLVLVKLACIEANKERVSLLASKKAEGGKGIAAAWQPREMGTLEKELAVAKGLESKLQATENELDCLRSDLAIAKQGEMKLAKATAEALAHLEQARSDLARTKASPISSLFTELNDTKANLKQAVDEVDSLKAAVEALQSELEETRKELAELKFREANATAASAALSTEVTRTKAELIAAAAAEARAEKAIYGLSHTLEQVTTEAEVSKWEAGTRTDTDQAKAQMSTAESKLVATLKEAGAAKAAEAIALRQYRALFGKTSAVRASEVEAGVVLTISQDEHDSLKRKMQEAEELATLRLTAVIAQVEATKASEVETLHKLETSKKDIGDIMVATKRALHRTEMAEATKSAVENELKRFEEKEQWLREQEVTLEAHQPFLEDGSIDRSSLSSQISQVGPLAKVLNMKIHSPETGRQSTDTLSTLKKKKDYSSIIWSIHIKKEESLDSQLSFKEIYLKLQKTALL